ncbi:MAG: hypothetical protein WB689_27850 [Xanthobacteraceae bacterium]
MAIVSRAETEGQSGMAALAEGYEVPPRSATRTNKAPDAAILREAERGYDLVCSASTGARSRSSSNANPSPAPNPPHSCRTE